MNASAFRVELAVAGIHLTREGDSLRVRATPGVHLAPYVESIRQQKPALLAALLQTEIIAAVTVEPEAFDRPAYERLVALWAAYDAGPAST